MSWYRIYRPQTISELHSAVIRQAFDHIRESGSFSHAYLLTGPKGTGKTSSARILAKMLNCEKNTKAVREGQSESQSNKTSKKSVKPFVEPCGVCDSCKRITIGSSLCVTEMDAASNRGIDDIRILRERVNLVPSDGLVSVYIIDEVHMLTTEAFNALLKVLEEPPAHVVFVLATTELRKVPDTILSRCTMIQFSRASQEELMNALKHVAKKEGITVADNILKEFASRGDGSYRDAIKLFEQVAHGKTTISDEDASLVSESSIGALVLELFTALEKKDAQMVVKLFQQFEAQSIDIPHLHKRLLQIIHEKLIENIYAQNTREIQHLQLLLQTLNVSPDPLLPLPTLPFELAALSWCLENNKSQDRSQKKEDISKENRIEKAEVVPKNQDSKVAPIVQEDLVIEGDDTTTSITPQDMEQKWPQLLKEVRLANATIEALLRAARPLGISGKTATIEVFYSFHKEQLEQEKHRRTLEKVLSAMFGMQNMKAAFSLGDKNGRPQKKKEA
ncbi:MAG: DNA polymerase III subunit gamma/tau, partial [Patescibacteria group bacterium]